MSGLDVAAMIVRERWTALAVMLAVLALAAVAAFFQPNEYTAQTRILVRMGDEYVFQSRVGAPGGGAAPRLDEVSAAELRLLTSPELARRTIARIGASKLYPALARLPKERAMAAAERNFSKALRASIAPNAPIITLSFAHGDRKIAAAALNALTEAYFLFRREVLVDPSLGGYVSQSEAFSVRSREAAAAMTAFLQRNGIGDYEADLRAEVALAAELDRQHSDAVSRRREAEGRAASLRARLAGTPQQIEIYAETDLGKKLNDLRVEREMLLGRFQADAAPVLEIERRIAQVEAYVKSETRAGLVRRGVNPVRQSLEADLYGAEAEARAQATRAAAITAERVQVDGRLRRLQGLEPEYRRLALARGVMDDSARAFRLRAEEAQALSAMSGAKTDVIRQIEPATPPFKPSTRRWPIVALGAALALILGIAAALARGLMRNAFPTGESAARLLEAPLLGLTMRNGEMARTPA